MGCGSSSSQKIRTAKRTYREQIEFDTCSSEISRERGEPDGKERPPPDITSDYLNRTSLEVPSLTSGRRSKVKDKNEADKRVSLEINDFDKIQDESLLSDSILDASETTE
ncbi:uncharacterized protein LOC144343556 [Saccoglossus kowalevskii]